jgi:hypothetical protein
MVLIGIIEQDMLREFIATTGWRGESWLDPGAAFSLKHRMADCPRLAVEVEGALEAIEVSEARDKAGSANRVLEANR